MDPFLILGQDLLFWIAAVLTVVIFLDLATCWWAARLKICPFKKYSGKLTRYHKYTRIALIILAIAHMALHILFQVFGIIF